MDYPAEEPTYATFERLADLKNWQGSLLSLDLFREPNDEEQTHEAWLEQKFSSTLSEYQEQSYLLDPFLEELVTPIVESLKAYAVSMIEDPTKSSSAIRVSRVSVLLYHYVKFRGYKTIIRFFPHEVPDLSIVLDFVQVPGGLMNSPEQWALRYVILLWLYIICIIPFDLAQFDDPTQSGHTARSLQELAKRYLNNAGLEREGAALLLSRLYIRKDTGIGFHDFVIWTRDLLKDSNDVMLAVGVLQALCEVVKSGSATQVQSEIAALMSVARILQEDTTVSVNTIVRKYKSKVVSRIGLRLLPGRANARRRDVRTLAAGEESTNAEELHDFDVPTEVEEILEQLLGALQDKDTIVRWSAAKGVARIAERLPKDFANQILETVLGLFEIHSIAAATLYDLPAIAEGTWHGACLACAEIARRSLIEPQYLPKLVEWLSKALYFDLRKGAHSIGSNVRDAAAYVLWALARTQNKSALVPHAEELAQRLTAVALFDREVHIRRAASAAFQEHVGRTSLFPHGIDVLGKTDFYVVSIRRHAFLIAAPYVARHEEYRRFLVDHLLDVVIRHWDVTMRELAAHSLRLICLHDLVGLSRVVIKKSAPLLDSLDTTDVHGGLSALSEIAIAYKEGIEEPSELDQCLHDVFTQLTRVPEKTFTTTRNEIIAAAACRLIANSITRKEINLTEAVALPKWKRIVDVGLKHRHTSVQESAADAMAQISRLTDCSAYLSRLIAEMKRGTPTLQRSLARLLGVVDWTTHLSVLPDAINYLLDKVHSAGDVETRRSCFQAIPRILTTVSDSLTSIISSDIANSLLDALINGLNDYTIDERGDVGSWIRVACIQGLTDIADLFFRDLVLGSQSQRSNQLDTVKLETYLPVEKFHTIVAGVLKQGVEKLDNVRQEAGICFMKLLNLGLPGDNELDRWRLHGVKLLTEQFPRASEQQHGWNDANWLFPRAVRLLEIGSYRKHLLSGIVMSIGSRTDSTQKAAANSFVEFAQALPLVQSTGTVYSLLELVSDLINHAKSNLSSNAIVVPTLQAFVLLFEADSLRQLPTESLGMESLKTLIKITSKNVDKMKSIQRIHESMKIVVNLLIFEETRSDMAPLLPNFLAHMFPKVRADTAEYLYVLLQSTDLGYETERLEEILLETEWSADITIACEAANNVVGLFAHSA